MFTVGRKYCETGFTEQTKKNVAEPKRGQTRFISAFDSQSKYIDILGMLKWKLFKNFYSGGRQSTKCKYFFYSIEMQFVCTATEIPIASTVSMFIYVLCVYCNQRYHSIRI